MYRSGICYQYARGDWLSPDIQKCGKMNINYRTNQSALTTAPIQLFLRTNFLKKEARHAAVTGGVSNLCQTSLFVVWVRINSLLGCVSKQIRWLTFPVKPSTATHSTSYFERTFLKVAVFPAVRIFTVCQP